MRVVECSGSAPKSQDQLGRDPEDPRWDWLRCFSRPRGDFNYPHRVISVVAVPVPNPWISYFPYPNISHKNPGKKGKHQNRKIWWGNWDLKFKNYGFFHEIHRLKKCFGESRSGKLPGNGIEWSQKFFGNPGGCTEGAANGSGMLGISPLTPLNPLFSSPFSVEKEPAPVYSLKIYGKGELESMEKVLQDGTGMEPGSSADFLIFLGIGVFDPWLRMLGE